MELRADIRLLPSADLRLRQRRRHVVDSPPGKGIAPRRTTHASQSAPMERRGSDHALPLASIPTDGRHLASRVSTGLSAALPSTIATATRLVKIRIEKRHLTDRCLATLIDYVAISISVCVS